MPKKTTKSGLFGKLGTQLTKAHAAHKDDDVKLGGGGDLPAGIDGGVAQLVECKFDTYKTGDNVGEYYFYAAGIVKTPKEVKGVPIEGLRTSIMEPVCETPGRKRETVEEHVDWIYNELRKLGVDTKEIDPSELEDIVASLKEAKPHFRFRTWQGEATKEYPNPRVNHDWRGACEFDETDGDRSEDAVEDETVDEEAEETEEAEDKEASEDLAALGKAADKGDEEAQQRLTDLASESGLDPEEYDTWKALAKALEEADGEEEEAEEEEAEEEEEEDTSEISVDDMGRLADEDGDEQCMEKLTDLAEAAGLDPDDFETWHALAKKLVAAKIKGGKKPAAKEEVEEEEEEEEEFTPTVGDVYYYKPPKAKKAMECEVMAVMVAKQLVNLKGLDDEKLYKAVPWDQLSQG